jgi:Rod binding domain-containing protein
MNLLSPVTALTAIGSAGTPAPNRPGADTAPVSDARKLAAMKTARDYESVFLGKFAQIMFEGVKSDGPFGGGPSEDIFKSMLAQEYGKSIAGAGGIGIADSIYREIIKSQEIA